MHVGRCYVVGGSFFSGKARVGGEWGGGDKRRREEGEAKSPLSPGLPIFFTRSFRVFLKE